MGWRMVTATVASSEFHYARSQDINAESQASTDISFHVVRFVYTVDGEEFNGALEMYDPLEAGEQFPISYNPADPAEYSTVTRRVSSLNRLLILTIGIVLAAVLIYLVDHFGLASE